MKLYYSPSFNNSTYIKYSEHEEMLWDTAVVGTNALLDQLLLRFGLTQIPAEDTEFATNSRRSQYAQLLTDNWIKDSLSVDSEGTTDQVLAWRDCLIMEGWTREMTEHSPSQKLSSLSRWESKYNPMTIPGRADLWRCLADQLSNKTTQDIAGNLEIIVCLPKVLVPKLVIEVIEKVSKVTYKEFNDTKLKVIGRTIYPVKEQYESWQLAALQDLQEDTLVVCENEDRLNNTLKGLKSEKFDIGNSHCIHPTGDITNQLDTPNKIVWLDCVGNKGAAYRFDFLTNAELKELAKVGLQLPKHEELSMAHQQWIITLLNKAESVELIVPKYEDGMLLPEHPIVTELKNSGVKVQDPKVLPLSNKANVISFSSTDYVNLNANIVKKLQKGSDSASSMETLFQRPFDYLMEQMMDLKAPEDDEDEKLSLIKGKVAHKVVELMLDNHKGDRKGFISELNNYSTLFDQAISLEGKLLKEPENKNELAVFKKELQESIKALCGIIRDLNLTPQECEKEFNSSMGVFKNTHGFIDMILTDKNGDHVIFDFKYSTSKNYAEKLSNNQSLQLSYYAHALKKETKKKVAWYGYYLFPKQTLYTKNDSLVGKNNIEVVTPAANAPTDNKFWKMMEATYKYRMNEINSGKIEEGEGWDISGFDISNKTGTISLAGDFKEKDKKATDFCKYKTEDSLKQKPTSHTILKNHLK